VRGTVAREEDEGSRPRHRKRARLNRRVKVLARTGAIGEATAVSEARWSVSAKVHEASAGSQSPVSFGESP